MPEPPVHTGVDEVSAHPRHTGHRWLDLVLALMAVFISGVSLYVAVDHGRIEQQLVQANSWPFLQVDGHYSRTSDNRVTLVNAGIGPAKLETMQVFYQGRLVDDFPELLRQCCGLSADRETRRLQMPEGMSIADASNAVIRPGEHRFMMLVPGSPEHHDVAEKFADASDSITYTACYCSVFDQCWVSHLVDLKPRPVAACPTGIASFNHAAR